MGRNKQSIILAQNPVESIKILDDIYEKIDDSLKVAAMFLNMAATEKIQNFEIKSGSELTRKELYLPVFFGFYQEATEKITAEGS